MQAVQQFPKFGECGRRCHCRPNGKVGALRTVGNPRRESANRAVRHLAENVLTFRELRPPFNAKALTVKWMKGVINLYDLGTMGIMFLARSTKVISISTRCHTDLSRLVANCWNTKFPVESVS
jgi:hypothetical protein